MTQIAVTMSSQVGVPVCVSLTRVRHCVVPTGPSSKVAVDESAVPPTGMDVVNPPPRIDFPAAHVTNTVFADVVFMPDVAVATA